MLFHKSASSVVFTLTCTVMCLISCAGCRESRSYPHATLFTRDDFPKKVSLQGTELPLDSLWRARRIYIHDSVLVVVDIQRSPFVRLFNIRDGRKIGSYIFAGRGPDELLFCSTVQIVGDRIWAIDEYQNKYLQYERKDPFAASFEAPVFGTVLKDIFFMNPIMVDSATVAGNGVSTGRLLTFYDLEKQEADTDAVIPYPFDIDGPDILKQRSFEHRMATDGAHIYMAYCHTDLIDIYDRSGSLVRRLFGPDHFVPDIRVEKIENEVLMTRGGKNARFAYFSPVMTADGLMVLYNGTLQRERNEVPNHLFLFSPSGDPLVEFSLDPLILHFCVDDSAKRIYGLTDTPDYRVICFDYGAYL